MYRARKWSARHSKLMHAVYEGVESLLVRLYPLFEKIGMQRVDRILIAIEKPVKSLLFDSQSCGQCTLGSTGMSCPMNCPKTIRNGPCGGVRSNGKCEVTPEMDCVWVVAWEGTQNLPVNDQAIQIIQPPLDSRLKGKSAWLRAVEQRINAL
ncbi:MAG: methylenetetrahydrofolate reductase C-terminal domain-containing protein [Pseudomonadales bacterium]